MHALTARSDQVRIRPARRLRGRLRVPGDKSITHRALLMAALAEGSSRIAGGSDGLDCGATVACIRAIGADIEQLAPAQRGRVDRIVRSPGARGLRTPRVVLDCANSGTTMRLVAGMLAGLPVEAVLDGDASLRRRPMARIIEPLRAMGAELRGAEGGNAPPLTVRGAPRLRPIDHAPAVPSAQVKSAVLLAALSGAGTTRIHEEVQTRTHTEEMLRARGVDVQIEGDEHGRTVVSLHGPAEVRPLDTDVPGDISAAAFWIVLALVHPDAEVTVEKVGLNATRRGVLDVLERMGARIEVRDVVSGREPTATLTARTSQLEGVELTADEVARSIDEIPVLALAAACARGRTIIRGAGELRHKESDRLTGIARGLTRLGAGASVAGDTLTVEPPRDGAHGLVGSDLETEDDHRLAMTFAVAGAVATGETVVRGPASVDVSHPGFFSDFERLRA